MPFSQGVDESTGLLGHFEGTILDAEFATNPEAATAEQRERVYLYLTVRVDDILQEGYEGSDTEEITCRMGLGKDWFTEDKRWVENKKDGTKLVRFRAQSQYGKWLMIMLGKADGWAQAGHAVKASDGDDPDISCDYGDIMETLDKRDANERDAYSYIGSQWEFRGVTFTYTSRGQDAIEVNTSVPVRYLGWDESVGQGGDEQGQLERESVADTAGQEEISGEGLTPEGEAGSVLFTEEAELNEKLNRELREATTYAEFRKKASLLATQANDDKALMLVLNERKVWNK